MSRHRNVRKLNIAEELEEDEFLSDNDYEEPPMSPETSKFLYKRPDFVVFSEENSQQKSDEKPDEWETYIDHEDDDRMFPMDEVIHIQPKNKVASNKIALNQQKVRQPQPENRSPQKQQQKSTSTSVMPQAVKNLRIGENVAKVRSNSKSPGRPVGAVIPKQTLSNLEMALATTPKYTQRSRPIDTKQVVNLIIIGHVDAGKSTLVGHLLYLLGNVDDRKMHRYRQDASRLGKSSFAFAWILDDTEEERIRGVTMDIARTCFEGPHGRKFNVLDAPGHKDFIPNMITGATQADAALLVVNATRGEFETGFDQGGQTREHALLIRTLGVSRLIVAVNKLDTVDWAHDRFEELCAILTAFLLKRAGFESVKFVPVSGLHGINLVHRPPTNHPLNSWHGHIPTLIEAFESLPLTATPAVEQPLRIVVNDVVRYSPTGIVISAKLESGHVEFGDKLFLMPEANPVTVKGVYIDEQVSISLGSTAALTSLAAPSRGGMEQQICFAGDQVTLTLSGAFEPDTVYPGHVLTRGGEELLMPCRHFRARLVTFDIQTPILKGTRAELFIHSQRAPCVISQLCVLHPGTKEFEKRNSRLLPRNVSAIVEICTEQPVNVEPFTKCKSLARLALRAAGETIAAGIVEKCL